MIYEGIELVDTHVECGQLRGTSFGLLFGCIWVWLVARLARALKPVYESFHGYANPIREYWARYWDYSQATRQAFSSTKKALQAAALVLIAVVGLMFSGWRSVSQIIPLTTQFKPTLPVLLSLLDRNELETICNPVGSSEHIVIGRPTVYPQNNVSIVNPTYVKIGLFFDIVSQCRVINGIRRNSPNTRQIFFKRTRNFSLWNKLSAMPYHKILGGSFPAIFEVYNWIKGLSSFDDRRDSVNKNPSSLVQLESTDGGVNGFFRSANLLFGRGSALLGGASRSGSDPYRFFSYYPQSDIGDSDDNADTQGHRFNYKAYAVALFCTGFSGFFLIYFGLRTLEFSAKYWLGLCSLAVGLVFCGGGFNLGAYFLYAALQGR